MLVILIGAALLAGARSEHRIIPEECNPRLYTHYDEMGCTPVFGTGPCPVKYDCPEVQSRSRDKCYVGGTAYEQGASIGSFYRACSAACICREENNSAKVTCAQVECPELFNPAYRPPECIPQYSIDDCCSGHQFCPNETKNTTDVTCEYGGSNLIQGQRFYPTEESCKVCVCQEGFDGTLKEPWCKKIFCGIELHHGEYIRNGCIPIYYSGCCPLEYHCPEDGDQVLQDLSEDGADARTSADKCMYGAQQMNVGDKLSWPNSCTECTCTTPPIVTCTKICNL